METRPDLVRLAQAGDTTAARSLIAQNYPSVYRLALSVLDDPVQAALAAHEAGTAQLDHLDDYPGPEAYTAWLYRLTLGVCRRRLGLLRAQGIVQRLPLGLGKRFAPAGPTASAAAEEADPFIRAAAQLDEGQRLVLVLRYGHELLPHEIGLVLNWRDSSVQARLAQARQRLHSLLNRHDPPEAPLWPQSDLDHRQAEKLIEDAADHHITDADAARLARHLKECPRCAAAAGRLAALENDLRAAFHARWMVENPPEAGVVSAALDHRRRRRALVRTLSLGAALLFTALVAGLIVFLPSTYPAQSGAAPTAAQTKPAAEADEVTPTESSRSRRPVNNRELLTGIYPGKLAFIAFSELSDHLFTFQPGTRDYRQFTAGFADDFAPAWSPDGGRVAYLSQPEGRGPNRLYVADANGENIRAIPGPDFSAWMTPTQDPADARDPIYPHYGPPRWSPDGQLLAAAVWANPNNHFLVVQSVREDSVLMLLPVQGIDPDYVAWSPDGSALAYLANSERELRTWQPRLPVEAGTNPRLLNFDGSWDDVFGLAWSPDSRQLAVLGGLREQDVMQVDLHMINSSGEALQTLPISTGILTRGPKRSSNLAWSPDGRYLGFIPVFTNSDLVYGRILLIPAGGKDPKPALAEMEWEVTSFAWSPDGQWLAFTAGYEIWAASIAAYEAGEPPLARLSGSPGSDLSWQPVAGRPGIAAQPTPPTIPPDASLLESIYPGRLAFATSEAFGNHIVSMLPNGSEVQQLTAEVSVDSDPAWSPDGKRIAYLSIPGMWGVNQVNVIDADGKNRQTVSQADFPEFSAPSVDFPDSQVIHYPLYGRPHWSPDGKWLAATVWATASQSYLALLSPQGGSARYLQANNVDRWLMAWSPDSRSLAAFSQGSGGLWVWQIDQPEKPGENPRRIAADIIWNIGLGLAWSPDGGQIAVIVGVLKDARANASLTVYSQNGGIDWTMPISSDLEGQFPLGNINLTWSPDGRYLAFLPVYSTLDQTYGDITLVEISGSREKNLVRLTEPPFSYVWSPDGKWLAFSQGGEAWAASLEVFERGGDFLLQIATVGGGGLNWQPVDQAMP